MVDSNQESPQDNLSFALSPSQQQQQQQLIDESAKQDDEGGDEEEVDDASYESKKAKFHSSQTSVLQNDPVFEERQQHLTEFETLVSVSPVQIEEVRENPSRELDFDKNPSKVSGSVNEGLKTYGEDGFLGVSIDKECEDFGKDEIGLSQVGETNKGSTEIPSPVQEVKSWSELGQHETPTKKAEERTEKKGHGILEVIDETVVMQSPTVTKTAIGNGKAGSHENVERNGNANNKHVKEVEGKRKSRREKGVKKVLETDGKKNSDFAIKIRGTEHFGQKGGIKNRRVYSRNELELLRHMNAEEQQKMWSAIYRGLGHPIAQEYDGLASSNTSYQKHGCFNSDSRQHFGRRDQAILGNTPPFLAGTGAMLQLIQLKLSQHSSISKIQTRVLLKGKHALVLSGFRILLGLLLRVSQALYLGLQFRSIDESDLHSGRPNPQYRGSGEASSQHLDDDKDNDSMNPLDPGYNHNICSEDNHIIEGKGSEDGEAGFSDEDCSTIQKPAFLVRGEPNFDSGPPEDGFEYLRHVRWEAAQIPNVKIAKIDQTKLNKEQTVYMPKIPTIAKCPENLLPLKHWEDEFLADFVDLRLALSRVEDSSSSDEKLGSKQSIPEDRSSQPLKSATNKFYKVKTDKADIFDSNDSDLSTTDKDPSPSAKESRPTVFGVKNLENNPTVSAILSMDSVARVSMLRKRISSIGTASLLSRNDCLWLFALCAAVNTPLHADACADMRSLLRKCASLRAQEVEVDEEVIMLNMLATIAGRYFGQLKK
ncbi:Gemin2/Brr1 [Dillenia turbinata]|uniref:Gemin2/Brr1 n=1 Tax=Dillenia turbinata TaxID=194707 RepID=A0AAN8ZRE0_9MAGN